MVKIIASDLSNSQVRTIGVGFENWGANSLPNYIYRHHSEPVVTDTDKTWENSLVSKTFHLKRKGVDNWFTVGKAAQFQRHSINPIGVQKFSESFVPIIVASSLISVISNTQSDSIELEYAFMHPFNYSRDDVDQIKRNIGGNYRIHYNGKTIKFFITKVHSLPESYGAGLYIQPELGNLFSGLPRLKNVLILDGGHGTSQYMIWDVGARNGIGSTYRTLGIGGKIYVEKLSQYIASKTKWELGNNSDRVLFNDNLFFALNNGYYPLDAGDTLDVSEFVNDLQREYANDFQAAYSRPDGVTIDAIALTGGASLLFGKSVVEKVFPRFTWDENAKLICKRADDIRLVNLNGYVSGIKKWL